MTAPRRLMMPAAAVTLCAALISCSESTGPTDNTPAASDPAGLSGSVGSGAPHAPAADGAPSGDPVDIATGLDAPWSLVFFDGAPLVSERDSARILEVLPDGSTRTAGAVEGVTAGGEAGLLGLAVRGDALYVYSTGEDGNRIQRYPVTGGAGALTLGAPRTILDDLPSAGVHNGGRIAFGPDGMLYAGVGDAGDGSDAQDLDSLGGKILRMTPDGAVPDDNPFPGSLVYSYGHRNVQGLAWAEDGTMFASEFGQDTWDELNIIEPGDDYGWPDVEGAAGEDGFLDPVQQWRPADASPSGITIADGTVFIANLRGQRLRAVPVADPTAAIDDISRFGRLRDVVVSPDHDLWILTNNTDGRGSPAPGDDRIVSVDLAAGD